MTYLDYDKINLTTYGKQDQKPANIYDPYKTSSRKARAIYNDCLEKEEVISPKMWKLARWIRAEYFKLEVFF